MTLLRHRDRLEGDLVIEVAFTDVSLSLGDDAGAEVREAALRQVADETGATPVLMHQVHGAEVVVVSGPDLEAPSCDALLTDCLLYTSPSPRD